MSQFATGVTIVTTRYRDELAGMTLNSFNSVSLDPPLVSICVTRNTVSHDMILHSGLFAVNILSAEQQGLALRFATAPAEARFVGLPTVSTPAGLPVLPDALAWLDVRIVHRYDGGDHSIFIGEVTHMDVLHETKDPLIYFRSQFTGLPRSGS